MNRHYTRENILMVVSTLKGIQHHQSLEKCQIKTQRDFTIDLSEWLILKTRTKSSAGENVESLDLLHTAGGNFNYYSCLRKCIWQYPLKEPATLSSTESTEIDIYMHEKACRQQKRKFQSRLQSGNNPNVHRKWISCSILI